LYVIHTPEEIFDAAVGNPSLRLERLFGLTSQGRSGVRLIQHDLDEAEFIIALGRSNGCHTCGTG